MSFLTILLSRYSGTRPSPKAPLRRRILRLEPLETRHCLSGVAALDLSIATVVDAAQKTAPSSDYSYARHGNQQNAGPMTGLGGVALEGGGTDVDAAFRWMISHMGGKGDFLVLTATKDTAYDSYVYNLGGVNSVATLEIPSVAAANDPAVSSIIQSADAIFIRGGSQNDYINFWQGTQVQTAIAADIVKGVPIGGTSAGADVIGQFIYSAENNSATSATALADPFNSDMTFAHNFVGSGPDAAASSAPTVLPVLNNTIVDTHMITRDRTGRMIVFLADLANPASPVAYAANHQPQGIGLNEETALLIPTATNSSIHETAGIATVIGNAKAKSPPQVEFFATPTWAKKNGFVDVAGQPLTYGPVLVDQVLPGGTFNLNNWAANWQGSRPFSTLSTISVSNGVLTISSYASVAVNNSVVTAAATSKAQPSADSSSNQAVSIAGSNSDNSAADHVNNQALLSLLHEWRNGVTSLRRMDKAVSGSVKTPLTDAPLIDHAHSDALFGTG